MIGRRSFLGLSIGAVASAVVPVASVAAPIEKAEPAEYGVTIGHAFLESNIISRRIVIEWLDDRVTTRHYYEYGVKRPDRSSVVVDAVFIDDAGVAERTDKSGLEVVFPC